MEQRREGTVMLVDDDPQVLLSLAIMLKTHGFSVASYGDGGKALADFTTVKPDVVVSDLRMPGISGIMLMERLRSIDTETPLIFITGNAEVEEVIAALRMRAFDLLLKPFNHTVLLAALDKAIDSRHTTADEIRSCNAE